MNYNTRLSVTVTGVVNYNMRLSLLTVTGVVNYTNNFNVILLKQSTTHPGLANAALANIYI